MKKLVYFMVALMIVVGTATAANARTSFRSLVNDALNVRLGGGYYGTPYGNPYYGYNAYNAYSPYVAPVYGDRDWDDVAPVNPYFNGYTGNAWYPFY